MSLRLTLRIALLAFAFIAIALSSACTDVSNDTEMTNSTGESATSTNWTEDVLKLHEEHDYATALKIVEPMAERGDARAQAILGSTYESGLGVIRNLPEAVRCTLALAGRCRGAITSSSLGDPTAAPSNDGVCGGGTDMYTAPLPAVPPLQGGSPIPTVH